LLSIIDLNQFEKQRDFKETKLDNKDVIPGFVIRISLNKTWKNILFYYNLVLFVTYIHEKK